MESSSDQKNAKKGKKINTNDEYDEDEESEEAVVTGSDHSDPDADRIQIRKKRVRGSLGADASAYD